VTAERGAGQKTAAYYCSYILLGLTTGVIGPTLPALAEQTQARLSEISTLFTALAAGYMLGSLLGGWLYDRTPGHPLVLAALAGMLAGTLLVPFLPILWVLMAVVFVLGVGQGVLDVGGNTLLVWVHGKRVGPFMNGLHFSFGLGALLAPLLVVQAVKMSGGIRWAYVLLGLLAVPIAAFLGRLPSPPHHGAGGERAAKNDPALVALITLFFFLHVGGELSFGGWIFTYADRSGLADGTVAAYLTSAFWGSLTLGRLLGIPIASFVRPENALVGDVAGCIAGTSLMIAFPHSRAVLWAGTVLTGLSVASIFPASFTFAERRLHMSGRVTSWFLIGASVGSMFLPWFIGQLFEAAGPRVTPRVLAVNYAAALGVLLVTLRRAKKTAAR
jgi:FHS family Na+ dependent glucose MFS transporter 1